MNSSKLKNWFTLVTFTCMFIVPSLAQRTLFNPIPWNEFDAPLGTEDLLISIQGNTLYDTVFPVEVDYLPDFQINGELKFKMPLIIDTIFAFAQQVKFVDEYDFVWRGRLTTGDGDMMIIENNGNVFGYFFKDSTIMYELIDLGGHKNLLAKFTATYLDSVDCGVEEIESFHEPKITYRGEECTEDDVKPIRILVFYSEKAAEVSNPDQKAKMFLEQLNMGLDNSAISKDEVFFQISDVIELEGFEETLNENDDLNSFKNAVLGTPDLREATGSDIAVLLVDGNYEGAFGSAFQQNFGEREFSFGIVEIDGGVKYTFAHEVAHTLGCRHIFDDSQDPDYAQSYYWKHNGRKRSTIMNPTKKARILYYSNPDVLYDGHVTGVEDGLDPGNDNARQLVEANDVLADNFCFDPEMLVWIEGPRKGIETTPYTWFANSLFCDDIVNYLWEISYDGISYSTYANSSTADQISSYLPTDLDLFIRLTITCDDSQIMTDYIHVYNLDNGFIDPIIESSEDESSSVGEILTHFNVTPNPSSEEVSFTFTLKEESEINIHRVNSVGESYLVQKGHYSKGTHTIFNRKPVLVLGLFYYTISTGKEILTKKIIHQK